MAITDEQRAAVKKRAQELLATGMSTGAAAQQAYAEIVPKPTEKQEAQQAAILESPTAETKLKETRAAYVTERGETLERTGLSKIQAASQAEKEFESQYLKPVVSSFEEQKPEKFLGAFDIPASRPEELPPVTPAGLLEALKPKTFLPTSAIPTERQEVAKPSEPGGIIGAGPDWDVVTRDLLNQGLSKEDADSQVFAFKGAYDAKIAEKKRGIPKGGLAPQNLAADAWKETLDEVQKIPSILADKSSYVTDYKPTGPNDPYFLAFSKQVKAGEGVPKVSEAQGKYIASLAERARKAEEDKIRKEYEGKPLKKTEVERPEGIRGGAARSVTRELVGAEKDAEIARMAAERIEKPFWTDPQEVEKRLADPTRYQKPGVFKAETVFGTQRESTVGFLTRAAMAPLNAVAGAAFPIVFTGGVAIPGVTDDSEGAIDAAIARKGAAEEARRRARPEAYKDSPILLNIAQGRGFVGEAAELSKITGLDLDKILEVGPVSISLGTLYTAGAFAADLLDPSLDVLSGLTKGARVGLQTAKAAKEIGVEGAKTLGAKLGAEEAIKTVLFENPAISLVTRRFGFAPGDIRLSISDAVAKQAGRDLFDASGARRLPPASSPEIVQNLSKKLDELDQLVKPDLGKSVKPLSRQEFADALIEASVRNPDVAAAVERLPPGAKPAALQRDPVVLRAVQDSLVRQAARSEVFKATGDSVLKSGIVALTRNTFATKDVVNEVLKEYSASPLAKLVKEIQKSPKFGRVRVADETGAFGSQAAAFEGFKLDKNSPEFSQLLEQTGRLARQGNIKDIDLRSIQDDDFISSAAIRQIIDAEIDTIAKKYRVATGADIAQTTPIIARELRTPLETRDFSAPAFRKFISQYINSKPPVTPVEMLTPAQRAVYEPVVDALGKLDSKLRNEMNAIMRNPGFREVYGVPDGVNDRMELLGYLITGPGISGLDRSYVLQKSLKGAVDNVLYTKDTKLNIFDLFDGIRTDEITDIWSAKGRMELDDLIDQSVRIIDGNPAKYAEEMSKVVEGAKVLKNDPTNIKVDPGEVLVREDKFNERMIASYYLAESSRVLNQTVKNVVLSQSDDIADSFRSLGADRSAIGGGDVQAYGDIIYNYVRNVTEDPNFLQKNLSEIFNAIVDRSVLTSRVSNPGRLVGEVADVAGKIMKVNGMKGAEDPLGDLRKIINLASVKDPEVVDTLRAFLGENVADQILKALEEGGAKNIQRGLAEAITNQKEAGPVPRALDAINSMFYLFTLTLAPRFHGGNIIGAPEVVYSTTGKLISPIPIPGTSTGDAMLIMRRAYGPEGGQVASTPMITLRGYSERPLIDAGGRGYTNNEIYRAVVQSAGETLNKVDIPSISARRALIQLQNGGKGTAQRAVDTILETPQTEDTMYRMAVVLEGLRDGLPLEQAIQLGRSALYDKGTIADFEKVLSRNIMFYSFTRNNLVNLLKNLTTVNGLKRISNVLKTKRGVESILVPDLTEKEKSYLPDVAATSYILGRAQDVGERGNIVTTGSSTLSAIQLLTKFLAFDVAGAAQSATPRLFQAIDTFKEKTGEEKLINVPVEHLAIIDGIAQTTGSNLEDVLSLLLGDRVVPYRSKEPGSYDGLIYPLPSPEARRRYQLAMLSLTIVGLERLSKDIPASLRAPGSKAEQAFKADAVGYGLTAAYAAGFLAPRSTTLAEKQRLRTLMNQTSEGKKMASDIDEILRNDALAPVAETITQKEIKEAKVEKKRAYQTISDYEQRELELGIRFESLKSQVLTGQITEAYFEQEAMKIEEELNKLYAQMAAAGQ